MSDIQMFIFMVVTLAVMNLLLVNYDSDICPNVNAQTFNYTEGVPPPQAEEDEPDLNQTYFYVREQSCDNLPNWVYLVLNSPFLMATGMIMKKYLIF